MKDAKRRERAEARTRGVDLAARRDDDAVRAALDAWLAERPRCTVVGYVALRSEVDLGPIVGGHGHRWGLVRLLDAGGLDAAPWDGPRRRSRHGTEEPLPDEPALELGPGDVVLVPGVAFDEHGFRLGRGGGHYDRYLAVLPDGVTTVGITTVGQVVEHLTVEAHDRPVHYLCTEHGVRTTQPRPSGSSALLDGVEDQHGGPGLA